MKKSAHAAPPKVVSDFLRGVLPFAELPEELLDRLSREASIDFVPAGTRFIEQGATPIDWLYVIQKGGVKSYLTSEDGAQTLIDVQGEGGTFGSLAIIRGSLANFNVETVEDSFFFRIGKEAFLRLIAERPDVAQFYLKTMSEAYVSKAFTELSRLRAPEEGSGRLSLLSLRVGDVVRRSLVTLDASASIRDAAEVMGRSGVGSLAITEAGRVEGIVTDRDFRDKAVARELAYTEPVGRIMSSPLKAVDAGMLCFDALVAMMRAQIHHLGVRGAGGDVVGMITSHDFMVLQGSSPLSLFREIKNENSLEGLCGLSAKTPLVVRSLFEEGAKASAMGRMIAVVNDLVLERLLTLLQEELGPPPAPFCWLVMGSEGRREQTLRTDQDNALVWRDPEDPAESGRCEEYFSRLGVRAVEALGQCGYPPCPGGMMAANPKWRMPFSRWRSLFSSWISKPEPEEILHVGIFFDFRAGFGYAELAERLRDTVTEQARGNEIFLRHLAQDCLRFKPPLTFFKSFVVEKDGEHRNTLDIKARGVMPLTDYGRLLALRGGIRETNTLERFRLAADTGLISSEFRKDLSESYEFLMQIRLAHQLRRMESDEVPDNRIDPESLGELERRTLKEAFSVIGRMQTAVRESFRLNL